MAFQPNLAIPPKLKKITGSCTQITVISGLTLEKIKKKIKRKKIFWLKIEG